MDTKVRPQDNLTGRNPKSPASAQARVPTKIRPKHVPQRSCIACRTHDAKRGLVRVVRTPEGRAEVDETGKKNGRGAYLCRTRECWESGLSRKGLDNALKMQIDPENRAQLKSYGEKLPGKSASESAEPTLFREGVRENAR